MIKNIRYSNQDDVLQALIIPVYIGVLNTILLGSTYWQNGRVFVFATGVTAVAAFAVWLINNAAGLYMDRQFPRVRQILTKLLTLFVWCLFSGGIAVTLIYGCYVWASDRLLLLHPGRLGWALLFQALVVVLVISIYEGIRSFERWERMLRETEQLKKANLQSQFECLKSQINPHFLFNSLNTLSSLIDEDGQQAQQFVEEMASVYRYLLRANEQELTTLARELQFIRSYFQLLKTRYGSGISLYIAVDERLLEYKTPPLTLQLLVENAVKHNVIQPERPLLVEILTRGPSLVVQNNLQRKNTAAPSNKVGLANIATKYRLLGQPGISIREEAGLFVVTLPLLVNQPEMNAAK